MRKFLIILGVLFFLIGIAAYWGVKIHNDLQRQRLDVENAWANVESKYQRRMDLIPNLVNTVKGYAEHEQNTLQGVTEARSRLGGVVNIDSDVLNNPQAFEQYQQAQSSLSGALQRLMVSVERYPELKADANFRQLQDELEGTENRISVERDRFNEAVNTYNKSIVVFPKNIFAGVFGFTKLNFFRAQSGAEQAPKVEF